MEQIEKVLAIETSCDDTSVAIVEHSGFVLDVASANQDLVHSPFGGIVPEIASRNHTLTLLPLIETVFERSAHSWELLDGIVVTSRPGLIGSLLVGVITAKTLALGLGKPFLGVNHLEGHLLSPFLKDREAAPPADFDFPYVGLVVSGGHSSLFLVKGIGQYELLGQTLDDAAGEAFDKFAKMLDLGFPGGVQVDRLSQRGNPKAYDFPRSLMRERSLDFSFSGVKTAGLRQVESMSPEQLSLEKENLCASYQEAIVEVLIAKLDRACRDCGILRASIVGGVSANSRVRFLGGEWAKKSGVQLVIPPLRYCTDNAAMIGFAGLSRMNMGERSTQELAVSSRSLATDFNMPLS